MYIICRHNDLRECNKRVTCSLRCAGVGDDITVALRLTHEEMGGDEDTDILTWIIRTSKDINGVSRISQTTWDSTHQGVLCKRRKGGTPCHTCTVAQFQLRSSTFLHTTLKTPGPSCLRQRKFISATRRKARVDRCNAHAASRVPL